MKTEFTGELNFTEAFWDNDYTFKVSLSVDDLTFINKAREIVKTNPEIYEITTFFYDIEVFENNNTESEGLDYGILHVSKDFLRVTGKLKHIDVGFSTGHLE